MSIVYMSLLRWIRCRNRCIPKAPFGYIAHCSRSCMLYITVRAHCTCCAVSKTGVSVEPTGVSVEPVYTVVLLLLVFYHYFSLRGRRITLRKWNGCLRQYIHTYIQWTLHRQYHTNSTNARQRNIAFQIACIQTSYVRDTV